MVKIKKEIEVNKCDECGSEEGVYDECIGCGKDICFDCKKKGGFEYNTSVFFSGSGDGYFCSKCDANPPKKVESLHQAYIQIAKLREERTTSYEDFEKRSKGAEKTIKRLRGEL